MPLQRVLIPGLLSLLALGALGACSSTEGDGSTPAQGSGGGKADDVDGVCESPECVEAYQACQARDAAPGECASEFAGCLAINEDASLLECSELDNEVRGACEACDTVPECDVVEDGADANLCLGARAGCQFASVGELPAGCLLPVPQDPCHAPECEDQYAECLLGDTLEACQGVYGNCVTAATGAGFGACALPSVELEDPCASITCRVELTECLETIDREGCTREFAACLAVEESFARSTCEALPAEAQETCELCMGVDACAVVEDGADANACAIAVAQCHWDALAVLPSACAMPPELQ